MLYRMTTAAAAALSTRPRQVAAAQFVGSDVGCASNASAIIRWVLGVGGRAHYESTGTRDGRIVLRTPGGDVDVRPGDYVVRTRLGAFCRIPAATFEDVYEPDPAAAART